MNQEVCENIKLFRRKFVKISGGKVESCSRIKDRNGRVVVGENKIRSTLKEYPEDLYNMDTEDLGVVHMWLC